MHCVCAIVYECNHSCAVGLETRVASCVLVVPCELNSLLVCCIVESLAKELIILHWQRMANQNISLLKGFVDEDPQEWL